MIVLIVYGSLYPWTFEARSLPANPLYILLHSWNANLTNRRFLFDVAVNIAIYIPLGMSGYLAMRRFRSRALGVLGPIAAGTLLSAAVEMTQLYTTQRLCSLVDLTNNALGSGIGVIAGLLFTQIVDVPITGPAFRLRDRGAVFLLFCWASFLLFPLFPVVSLGVWRAKISTFVHAPLVNPVPTLLSAAEWFAAGRLLIAAGARRPVLWLLGAVALLPLQFVIVNRNPTPADVTGAVLAVVLIAVLGRTPTVDLFGGISLLVAVALRGLAPFRFEGTPSSFLWIPFEGLLGTEWQNGITILLWKLFQYGASIWMLHRGGLRRMRATVIVTLVLTVVEVSQTRIPGHVPEINDPLLAVMLGLGFHVLARWRVDRAT